MSFARCKYDLRRIFLDGHLSPLGTRNKGAGPFWDDAYSIHQWKTNYAELTLRVLYLR